MLLSAAAQAVPALRTSARAAASLSESCAKHKLITLVLCLHPHKAAARLQDAAAGLTLLSGAGSASFAHVPRGSSQSLRELPTELLGNGSVLHESPQPGVTSQSTGQASPCLLHAGCASHSSLCLMTTLCLPRAATHPQVRLGMQRATAPQNPLALCRSTYCRWSLVWLIQCFGGRPPSSTVSGVARSAAQASSVVKGHTVCTPTPDLQIADLLALCRWQPSRSSALAGKLSSAGQLVT